MLFGNNVSTIFFRYKHRDWTHSRQEDRKRSIRQLGLRSHSTFMYTAFMPPSSLCLGNVFCTDPLPTPHHRPSPVPASRLLRAADGAPRYNIYILHINLNDAHARTSHLSSIHASTCVHPTSARGRHQHQPMTSFHSGSGVQRWKHQQTKKCVYGSDNRNLAKVWTPLLRF